MRCTNAALVGKQATETRALAHCKLPHAHASAIKGQVAACAAMLGMEVLAPLSPRRKKDTDAKADGDKRDLRKSDAPQDTVGRKANDKEKESLRQDGEAVEADTPEIQYVQ